MGARTHPEGPAVQKRRSDRIFLRIPLSILGTDQNGRDFGERAVTQMVSRFGASIVTKLSLSPEQELTLRPTDKKAIRARVIGQTSIGSDGHVYGIAFLNATIDVWGIHFPPLAEAERAITHLECCRCHGCESVPLNDLELDVFRANDRLRRICPQCGDLTIWRLAEYAPARQPLRPSRDPQPQRRLHPRLRMSLRACIAQPGADDDVVTTINMSRGGILVRSQRVYAAESWIELAVPYTPAAANIFVPARIIWRADVQGAYQYGIKYVRA